ncbi:MAG: sensor domain-containing diguanylate cyclase [Solirubrobacterales bacterium]|nr:sensor domain-containing diguanylate cyclase [Solirubrobacterales bacterium]
MPLAPRPTDIAAATAILREGGDPRETYCRAAVRLLRADSATLWEIDADELVLTASNLAAPSIARRRLTIGPGSAAGRAAADGRRFFAADAPNDPDADQEIVSRLGLRSILAEPIRTGDRATGALAVGWRTPVEDFDPVTSGFLSLMAVQASMSIERADLAARLERLALTDVLTGLPNRRGLGLDLDRELARAARLGSPLAYAMLDLDHFKEYNDAHGHAEGDRLLRHATRAWRSLIRTQDTLARWGGEEFALLLPDCGGDQTIAMEIVERVRAATPYGQTASVGLAIWNGSETAAQLTERADHALYAAKQTGRDQTLAA